MTPRTSPSDPATPGSIQVISRAAAVLRALADEPAGLSLSRLAEATGLPRSTVHRLLAALEVEQLVAPARPGGPMRLGPELLRLGDAGRPDLQQLLRPTMQRLFEELDETIDLAILDHDVLRFVDQIPAPHRLAAVSRVGATFPLHCTANGKAVLAQMEEDELAAVLGAELEAYTPNTITTHAALREELERVREAGVAVDREEHTLGICATGVASVDAVGRRLAVTVPMPAQRFAGREPEITRRMKQAGLSIQAAMHQRVPGPGRP